MTKLDCLIKELCPDGVEFIPLSIACRLSAGGDVPKGRFSKERTAEYGIPIYSNGIGKNALYGWTDKVRVSEPCVTISARGTIGYATLREEPFVPVVRLICAIPNSNINVRYLKYTIDTLTFRVPTSGIPQLTVPMVAKYKIPLPPLPVQCEIVRILDKFTELTTELTAELASELTARKKQYEYYRNELLTFGGTVPMVKLGDVSSIYDGTHQTPTYTSEGVRFVSVENIYALKQSKKCISTEDYERLYKVKPQKNDVFMTRIGSIGTCAVVEDDEPLAYYVTLTLIRPNQERINSRFLKHAVESIHGKNELWKRTLIHATPIKINLGEIGKISIPLPSLEEQTRIVAVLDKFDSLTTDISDSLPAEIEARKKQYKYYRDKLLAFKELEA